MTHIIVPIALQLQHKLDERVTKPQQQTLQLCSRDGVLCGQSHSLSPMDTWTEASNVHASASKD